MRVVLYTNANHCPLCDDARAALERLRPRLGFDLVEVPVDRDPRLTFRYALRVPVIEVDGDEAMFGKIDPAALEAALRARRHGPAPSVHSVAEARLTAPGTDPSPAPATPGKSPTSGGGNKLSEALGFGAAAPDAPSIAMPGGAAREPRRAFAGPLPGGEAPSDAPTLPPEPTPTLGGDLGAFGRPTPPPDAMVTVRAGSFAFGEDKRRVAVPEFEIDRDPVTNGDYERFVLATGHRPPLYWRAGRCPEDLRDHPVVGVDVFDAIAYARWAGKDLPYEDEWERAARGTDGRTYPWGDEPDLAANTARTGLKMTLPVGFYGKNVSPEGCRDMVGNAWELTLSPAPGGGVVVRGGSWFDFALYAKTYFRSSARSDARNGTIGFRCVRRPSPRADAPRAVVEGEVEAAIAARKHKGELPDPATWNPDRRDLVPDVRRLRAVVASNDEEAGLEPRPAAGPSPARPAVRKAFVAPAGPPPPMPVPPPAASASPVPPVPPAVPVPPAPTTVPPRLAFPAPAPVSPAAVTPAAVTPAAVTPAAVTPAAVTPAAVTPAAGTPAVGTPAASVPPTPAATPAVIGTAPVGAPKPAPVVPAAPSTVPPAVPPAATLPPVAPKPASPPAPLPTDVMKRISPAGAPVGAAPAAPTPLAPPTPGAVPVAPAAKLPVAPLNPLAVPGAPAPTAAKPAPVVGIPAKPATPLVTPAPAASPPKPDGVAPLNPLAPAATSAGTSAGTPVGTPAAPKPPLSATAAAPSPAVAPAAAASPAAMPAAPKPAAPPSASVPPVPVAPSSGAPRPAPAAGVPVAPKPPVPSAPSTPPAPAPARPTPPVGAPNATPSGVGTSSAAAPRPAAPSTAASASAASAPASGPGAATERAAAFRQAADEATRAVSAPVTTTSSTSADETSSPLRFALLVMSFLAAAVVLVTLVLNTGRGNADEVEDDPVRLGLPRLERAAGDDAFPVVLSGGSTTPDTTLLESGTVLLVFADAARDAGRETAELAVEMHRRLRAYDVRTVLVVPREVVTSERQADESVLKEKLSALGVKSDIAVLLDVADERGGSHLRRARWQVPESNAAVVVRGGLEVMRVTPPSGSAALVRAHLAPLVKTAANLGGLRPVQEGAVEEPDDGPTALDRPPRSPVGPAMR